MTALNHQTDGGIMRITLDRPPANALSQQIISELSEAVDIAENDAAVKVILIHGEGRFFSAGADIKEFTEVENSEDFSKLGENGQNLFDRIESFHKPVIAAIHGAALGGGLELAMACHIRYADPGAVFGLPELSLGLIPGFAGTQRLPRLVGVPKATEMLLTSASIKADEAEALGLVNKVTEADGVLEAAMKLARVIAGKSAVSVKLALECLNDARDGRYEEGAKREAVNFGKAFASEDAKEGIAAFMEKRKPEFKDR